MKPRNYQAKQARAGFSLVEMLGVILIIAVFLGIGVNVIKDMDKGKSITSAVSIAEGIFDEARTKAISTSGLARVVIHNDPGAGENEKFRRYLAVAQFGDFDSNGNFVPADPSAAGGNGSWVVTSTGTYLSQRAYFDLNGSGLIGANVPPQEFVIRLPGDNLAPVNCFYYEFNGEGLITSPGPGAGFVIARGSLPPNAAEPIFETSVDGGLADAGGFVIWRLGNSSRIQSASQINY